MRVINVFKSGAVALSLLLGQAVAAIPHFDSVPEALAASAQDKRSILLDFTGTDWCTACIFLSHEIIGSAEFEAAVGEQYSLVTVDFPRKPELVAQISVEEKQRRENLLASYKIVALPAVVVLDEGGLPYGLIQGANKSVAEYLPRLEATRQARAARDAAFAKAAGLTGGERAQALHEGLLAIPEVCRDKYTDVLAEIISNDPADSLGYAEANARVKRFVEQSAAFRQLSLSFAGKLKPEELKESIVQCESFLATPQLEPEIAQSCLSCMADAYALLRDIENMVKYTRKAYEMAPDSRRSKKLKSDLEYFEKNVLPKLQEGK